MASSKVCRLASKIHSLTQNLSKTNVHVSSIPSTIKSSSPAAATSRINRSFRLPVELSSCVSLFPLHSVIASARLVSSLSVESKSWGLVPQGMVIACYICIVIRFTVSLFVGVATVSSILDDVAPSLVRQF